MRYRHLFVLLSVGLMYLAGCVTKRPPQISDRFEIHAHCKTYHAAMGRTKGMFFTISIADLTNKNTVFKVDSLILNNTAFPFILLPSPPGVVKLECNLTKTKPEPELAPDGKVIYPPEKSDPIIDHHDFYPSRVHITLQGKQYSLPVKQFIISNQ